MARVLATVCLAFKLVIGAASAVAAANVTGVLSNGPPEKRINFVLVAEGYQAAEESKFLADATNAISLLLVNQPFLEYEKYFNAYAVFVASQESGTDHPNSNIWKNTYFNSTFDSFGRPELLSIPPNNFDSNPANGEGKVISLVEQAFPLYHVPLVLVNDPTVGGSSGAQVTIVSAHSGSREILAHEMGHGLAGLGDEYETFGIAPDIEEPNTTRETNRALIKWKAWIRPDTLIPTPNKPPGSFTNATRVGLFEGAHYQSNGWYRPKLNCKMRNYGAAFCEVCTEALVISMYERARPVESHFPTASSVTISNQQQHYQFNVTLLQPRINRLSVQWYLDGNALANETNASLVVNYDEIPGGSHVMTARVEDRTELVRSDPNELLKEEVAWLLEKPLAGPMGIKLPRIESNNLFFTVTNAAGSFVVERSANLIDWLPIATNNSAEIEIPLNLEASLFYRLKE